MGNQAAEMDKHLQLGEESPHAGPKNVSASFRANFKLLRPPLLPVMLGKQQFPVGI